MFKLLNNGRIIFRGTYQECVMHRARMDSSKGAHLSSLVILPCDIDADGSTGMVY